MNTKQTLASVGATETTTDIVDPTFPESIDYIHSEIERMKQEHSDAFYSNNGKTRGKNNRKVKARKKKTKKTHRKKKK